MKLRSAGSSLKVLKGTSPIGVIPCSLRFRFGLYRSNRLRKKSVRVEIGGIFGDIKSSPATHLTFLGQLCAIYFSRFLPKRLFPQPAKESPKCEQAFHVLWTDPEIHGIDAKP